MATFLRFLWAEFHRIISWRRWRSFSSSSYISTRPHTIWEIVSMLSHPINEIFGRYLCGPFRCFFPPIGNRLLKTFIYIYIYIYIEISVCICIHASTIQLGILHSLILPPPRYSLGRSGSSQWVPCSSVSFFPLPLPLSFYSFFCDCHSDFTPFSFAFSFSFSHSHTAIHLNSSVLLLEAFAIASH